MLSPVFAPLSSQHPLVYIRADSSLEAGGQDPCLHLFVWLAESVSYGCRTENLFSCWSSVEHPSHFLEASTVLKRWSLPPSSKQPVVD